MSRSDMPQPKRESEHHPIAGTPRIWPSVLVWIMLGAAMAAPWALLLFGDSLTVTR